MRRLLVLAIAMGMLIAMSAPASAAKPEEAYGTETFVLTPGCNTPVFGPPQPGLPDCRTADGNVFFTLLNPGTKTGTFTGTQFFEGHGVLFKNLDFVYNGIITFEGTVEGCGTGTVVFYNEGKGNLATGLSRNVQHVLPGKSTVKVQAKLELVDDGNGFSNTIFGSYHC